MSIYNTFREYAIANATKQTVLIDQLTRNAPVLASLPMEPTTHGLQNVFESIVSITAAGITDLDAELTEIDMETKIDHTDLSVIGGKMYVGRDKANLLGGPDAYFNKKIGPILKKTGQNTEVSILENNFRQYAITNNNYTSAGGSSGVNYSLICVKYSPGEINGLYDPRQAGEGKILQKTLLWGGNLGEKTFTYTDSRTETISVYGVEFKTYFGMQVINPNYVSAIVNIDIDSSTVKIPTELQISQMIANAEGMPGDTFIYAHPILWNYIANSYKSDHITVTADTKNMNFLLERWDDIPVIKTYNMAKGTEADVA